MKGPVGRRVTDSRRMGLQHPGGQVDRAGDAWCQVRSRSLSATTWQQQKVRTRARCAVASARRPITARVDPEVIGIQPDVMATGQRDEHAPPGLRGHRRREDLGLTGGDPLSRRAAQGSAVLRVLASSSQVDLMFACGLRQSSRTSRTYYVKVMRITGRIDLWPSASSVLERLLAMRS